MNKLLLTLVLPPLLAPALRAEEPASAESLFLNLSKLHLGAISDRTERKQYLTTIQLEKQRIQAHMLRGVYENAFELYKSGDYEKSQDIARKILAIDPAFSDAQMLLRASGELKSGIAPTEKALLSDRFTDGVNLYRQGRLVEAMRAWEEVVKLSPSNLKAKYWLSRVQRELSGERVRRGNEAYARKRYREALDQWYSALTFYKNDAKLSASIAKAENELRQEEASRGLQKALELYGQGNLAEAYEVLSKVQEYQPGDSRVAKLISEIKGEIADGYVSGGKKYYSARRYDEAIDSWSKAKNWGADARYLAQLISRAKEQQRAEETDRQRRTELAKKEAAEAAEKERLEKEEAARKQMQAELGASASGDKQSVSLPAPGPAGGVSEENKRASQEHFVTGVKYFGDGDYEKARSEWNAAKQLDPGNADAEAGLKKIDQMFGSAQ